MSEPTTDETGVTDETRATGVTDETDVEVHRTAGRKVVLGLLRAYQGARAGKLSPCRFYPSCSAYAVEAVERHGAWRGSLLAIRRLSRCRPLGGSGIDLVPLEVRHHRRAR